MPSLAEWNLEATLSEIVDAAIAGSGADFGEIQLIDSSSSALRIAAQRGFPEWWVDFWDSLPEGQGACGAALRRRERVIVEDVEQSPIFTGPALDMQRRASVRAVQSTPLVSRSGKPLGILSTHYKTPQRPNQNALRFLDLLARQAADALERIQDISRLRESEERFRAMADGIPALIWVSDPEGRALFINRAYEEFHRITLEELNVQGWQSLIHPHDLPAYAAQVKARLAERRGLRAQIRVKRYDGEWRWVECVAQPRISSDGEFLGLAGSSLDITDRLALEQTVRQNEERHRLALRGSPVTVWECDTDLRFTFVENLRPPITDPALIIGKRGCVGVADEVDVLGKVFIEH